MRGPQRAATGHLPRRDLARHGAAPRGLWGLWRVIVALTVGLLAVLVASLDVALIALAGGVTANLLIMLTQGWIARRSEAGRGQPCMHARALP
jgi:hypothetical protein